MSTIVKAAAVQISPVLYSRDGTVEKVVKKIRELGTKGVQFATFPETVIPYYPYFAFVLPAFAMAKEQLRLMEQSVTVPSAETRAIGQAAKEANMVISIGVNERDGDTIYNTQLLFDADGTLIQRRRKIMPTFHERMIWGQGDGSGLRAFDSAVGRIGQLACWEHYLVIGDVEPTQPNKSEANHTESAVREEPPIPETETSAHRFRPFCTPQYATMRCSRKRDSFQTSIRLK